MENKKRTFQDELMQYWSERSSSYGKQHQEELISEQKKQWQTIIQTIFSKNEQPIKTVLDIGTGPGFLAILLAELGYEVTAVDMTEDMLDQAKINAAYFAERIDWQRMDAENLIFEAEQFDAVVTRNVTWNLENPKQAYKEWLRVLKTGGILLNFDSNWYSYLYNDQIKQHYRKNRMQTKQLAVKDYYLGTDIQWMEQLAKDMPLSKIERPVWDEQHLNQLGFQKIVLHSEMSELLLSTVQKVNFEFSPIFLIEAKK